MRYVKSPRGTFMVGFPHTNPSEIDFIAPRAEEPKDPVWSSMIVFHSILQL